jgi:hypothetical protein
MVIFLTKVMSKYLLKLDINLYMLLQLTQNHRHLIRLSLNPDVHYKLMKALLQDCCNTSLGHKITKESNNGHLYDFLE